MKKWLGRSLKHKLALLITVATFVPVLSLGLFSYRIATQLTEEKAKTSGLNTLRQLEATLTGIFADVENMSLVLIGNSDVQAFLKSEEDNVLRRTDIVSLMTNLAISKEYVANIVIEPLDGKVPVTQRAIHESDFQDIAWREPLYYEQYPKWWSNVHRQRTSEGVKNVITLSRPIRSTDRYRVIGHMQINVDQAVIARQVRTAELEGSGFVFMIDNRQRIVAGPPDWETNSLMTEHFPHIGGFSGNSGTMDYGSGRDKTTVLYQKLSSFPWTLVGIIPSSDYRAQNAYFLTLTIAAVGIAMLLVLVFVVFLIQKVTNPLSALTKFLKEASPDEPLPALPVNSIDEVGQLVISYNRLSSRIVKLTEEVKRNESLKKEADMHALQVQINPHFLYNTLSSIQWLARMDRNTKIAAMVKSLSDFLRFSLNRGQEYCSVEQEIEHVRHYVHIQSIRYPERFRFHVDADPETLKKPMLKLLLQPLVENAMLHGILKIGIVGDIRVNIRSVPEGIRFEVSDNGAGIPAERLERLRQLLRDNPLSVEARTEQKEFYGLRNVHHRLLLHYGQDAGLTVESAEGKGTTVSFRIPAARNEGEKDA
jgi:two-component system sensor histidine kinase YesM